jgi:murein DD-endopeptidase MepM/ murein hydrolase activator NlpD
LATVLVVAGLTAGQPALASLSDPPVLPAPAPDSGPSAGEPTPGGGQVVRPVGGGVLVGFDAPETDWGAGHRGVDLAAHPGDEVRAALGGLVTFAGMVAGQGWVTVDHGEGLETTYGVLASWSVRPGQWVEAGDVLGVLGTGAVHLDWGAKLDGSYIDPLTLLGRWEIHLIDPERLVEPVVSAPGPGGVLGPVSVAGWTWPTAGRVGSGFGMRVHPITRVRRLHAGVDIGAPTGTPIVAAAAGVVTSAGRAGGYGNLVKIDHGGGVETRYAHASVLLVRAGQRVERGQLIARVGSTGLSTGPHLHFEVRVGGQPVDPLAFFRGG